ncbi:ParA family protein [Poseidonibacter lekithochrous]|uniref:ParA family protein n=1 Tax=Poseidonibacter TaxID=2321187 RepID=UPI001C08EACD|nr:MULTISPECIES: ParA family protein [Poseidonibacter]MBU3015570.1 ParA family protein [Poseidonibacter lekithochrous]MDO6828869.1 ParA family protein [Poseidonibacter sp. 1_MG-2023]
MQIIIYNQKGGVGKSMIATQLALSFDATIVELDPYGMLSDTLGDEIVYKVGLNETVPNIKEGDVIFDFGGFDDLRLDDISKNADLIIIPFNPTINSLGTTLKSYKRVKEQNIPILFVVNAVLNEKDVDESINFIKENTKDEIEYFVIPHTRALQTVENEGVSIIEFANTNGLRKHTYRKISATMKEFVNTVEEYL